MTRSLKLIGYWYDKSDGRDWPHPGSLVDFDWMKSERAFIVDYLKSGFRINEFLGYSWCRFADGPDEQEMGNAELTDGSWLWPESLHIYVDRYGVRLPDEFVDDMRKNNFQMTDGLVRDKLANVPVSLEFWMEWCSRNVPRERPMRRLAQSFREWFTIL